MSEFEGRHPIDTRQHAGCRSGEDPAEWQGGAVGTEDGGPPDEHIDCYRDSLAEFFDLAATGNMRPVIAERFVLLEAADAQEFMERGEYAGKVVLTAET
jgi:NADPH:quinone reductase-like Zn-dependent oxidoreductase